MNSAEVSRLTGVSYRRLDNWCSNGWIPGQPQRGKVGSGFSRNWSDADVLRVVEIRTAIDAANSVLDAAGLGGYQLSSQRRGLRAL